MSIERISGYSSAGTILEVGSAVRGLSVGDRVACAGAGHANHAEIVRVPRNLCAKVPDGVPTESAALTTIAAIALHGIRLADVRLGDRVAVIGCGLVGQIACRLLTAAGAEVYALDLDPNRAEWAAEGGPIRTIRVGPGAGDEVRQATDGHGVDQALVTAASPSNDPLLVAAELSRDRGTVVLVGDVPIEIPREALYTKELAFRVSRSYGPGRYDADYEERGHDYPIGYVRWTEQRNMQCVLDLQARDAVTLRDLIDELVPLERAKEAYERLSGAPARRPRGALAFRYDSVARSDSDSASRALTVARSSPARTPSDGPVRIGLIGPGGFANSVLIPAFTRAGAILVAVAGGAGPSAEATARKAGSARATTLEELVRADDVDAVVVATRHDTHASLAQTCLEAGKHVFCEKPLALTRAELDEVVDVGRRTDRVLTIGFNRRFAPHVQQTREFVEPVRGPLTVLYRVSAGQLGADSWLHDLEQGGGRLIGEGCHFLDTLAYVADSAISEVHASGFGVSGLPVQAHDNAVVTIRFENGSVGTLAYVAAGAPGVAKERLEVFAGDRTAILDDYRALDLHDGASRAQNRLRQQDKGHNREVEQFLHGVAEGWAPVPLAVIENVHLGCFAAIESLRTGKPVSVDGDRARSETQD